MKKFLAIDVKNLKKSFAGKPVVKGLNMRVYQGEVFGFLGSNGSGKTTSIRLLCGLLTPDEGQGFCIGYDVIRQSSEIKRHVGYMPQRFSLYQELTVYENLQFIAQVYDIPHIEANIEEVMGEIGLTSRSNQLAGELSGGWKQRLALACCLIHQPQLLLLDEPTAGIDPLARRDFWDLIHQLSLKGVTTLMSTHYMDEAERCHRLAYLSEGEVMVQGSVSEVIQATGLQTFLISGDLKSELLNALKSLSCVVQAAWFGRSFHVCSYNEIELKQQLSLLQVKHSFDFERISSSLEDAFIVLGQERR
jgi:ABC-2 type transport system ATP-binding protein